MHVVTHTDEIVQGVTKMNMWTSDAQLGRSAKIKFHKKHFSASPPEYLRRILPLWVSERCKRRKVLHV